MFKIQKKEYVNKTFRMPTDLVKKMQDLAQKTDVSLNAIVVQCCEYALDNIQSSDKQKSDEK